MLPEIDPEKLAHQLRLDPTQIAAWRSGFLKLGRSRGPSGKPERPKGYLTVREVFDQYGIPAKLLSQWRAEGMPFKTKHSMKLVSEDILGQWIELKKSTF